MERCPKCGAYLEIIECCGGGIFRCEPCQEYYFYGELIQFQRGSGEGDGEVQGQLHEEEDLPQPPNRQPSL